MAKIRDFDFFIGADPEIFVAKEGKPVSVYGHLPGDKANPHPVNRGAVQVDGMAAEFNIDPADNWPSFRANLTAVMDDLKRMLPGFELFQSPVAMFGSDYVRSQPLKARELGCDPDYDAYTGEQNPRPHGDNGMRTASGHIHIGWTRDLNPYEEDHLMACKVLAKAMDIYVTLPCLFLQAHLEKRHNIYVDPNHDKLRRDMYGKAGAYRPKSYGVEYRTPSNLWLFSPQARKLVYYNSLEAVKACFEDDEFFKGTEETVRNLINNCDTTNEEHMRNVFRLMSRFNVKTLAEYN